MSHITEIKIKVTDLGVLKAACQRMDLVFSEGQKNYAWYGSSSGRIPKDVALESPGVCDHAIIVPGARYEVGVRKHENEYRLLWDNWAGGGLERILGENAGLLMQAYGIEKAKREARRKGYLVQETKQDSGTVVLNLSTTGGAL